MAASLLALAIGAAGGLATALIDLADPMGDVGERVVLLVVWPLVFAPLIVVTLWPLTVPVIVVAGAVATYLRSRRGRAWPTSLRIVVYGYLLLIGLALLAL